MDRAELAARLVEADEGERNALLQDHRAALDVQLAYVLKDICLDGWSSNPQRSLAASATLRTISHLKTDPELNALRHWTQGLEALSKGDMAGAIATL
ncbi:MAG TPA: hypothetical protein VGD38_00800, partial [Pyrinomonadaceae bacterium]